MKKVVMTLVAAIAVSASVTSCGGSASISTEKDSLAYALGVDIGTNLWAQFDSTMNASLIAQGITDAYAKKTSMTTDEATQYIQHYMTVVKPAEEGKRNAKLSAEMLEVAAKEAGAVKSESGLIKVVTNQGTEIVVAVGDTVTAHYTLYDASGKKLQSSKDNGSPMTFTNEVPGMIAGFIEGVTGLGNGGAATLYIPSDIAYGDQGNGFVGPKAALKFEVEVVSIAKQTVKK